MNEFLHNVENDGALRILLAARAHLIGTRVTDTEYAKAGRFVAEAYLAALKHRAAETANQRRRRAILMFDASILERKRELWVRATIRLVAAGAMDLGTLLDRLKIRESRPVDPGGVARKMVLQRLAPALCMDGQSARKVEAALAAMTFEEQRRVAANALETEEGPEMSDEDADRLGALWEEYEAQGEDLTDDELTEDELGRTRRAGDQGGPRHADLLADLRVLFGAPKLGGPESRAGGNACCGAGRAIDGSLVDVKG